MKKAIVTALMLFTAFWVFAQTITLDPTQVIVLPMNGTTTINITSDTSWTATSDSPWLTVSPTSGSNNGTLTLTYQDNNTDQPRVAVVTVAHDTLSATCQVGQANPQIITDPDADQWWVTYEGATYQFGLAANVNVTIEDDANWLTIEPATFIVPTDSLSFQTAVNLTVTANSGPERTAHIIIRCTDTGITICTLNITLTQQRGPIDLVVSIDRSDSMGQPNQATHKLGKAINAVAEIFTPTDNANPAYPNIPPYMQAGDEFGIVSFQDRDPDADISNGLPLPTVNMPLAILANNSSGQLNVQPVTNGLGTIAQQIHQFGYTYTSLGLGMQLAITQLNAATTVNNNQSVIMISDGKENYAPYASATTVPLNIDFYVIGVGNTGYFDEAILQSIATGSGGLYFYTANNNDTALAMGQIFDEIIGNMAVTRMTRDVSENDHPAFEKEFRVDPYLDNITVNLNWINPESNINLTLVAPDGTEYNALGNNGKAYQYGEQDIKKVYKITNPQPGVWRAVMTPTSIFSPDFDYDHVAFMVSGSSSLKMDASIAQTASGEPVTLNATLRFADGQAITDAFVSALVTLPDRTQEEITLYDDGSHNDGSAYDGVYGTTYASVTSGSYVFDITAAGSDFTRFKTRSIYVSPTWIVSADNPPVHAKTTLKQNYPNPFNPTTSIAFSLGKTQNVTLNVYNVKGQLVRTLAKDKLTEGDHIVTWNGKDQQNRQVGSGVYFFKLITEETSLVKKGILIK